MPIEAQPWYRDPKAVELLCAGERLDGIYLVDCGACSTQVCVQHNKGLNRCSNCGFVADHLVGSAYTLADVLLPETPADVTREPGSTQSCPLR